MVDYEALRNTADTQRQIQLAKERQTNFDVLQTGDEILQLKNWQDQVAKKLIDLSEWAGPDNTRCKKRTMPLTSYTEQKFPVTNKAPKGKHSATKGRTTTPGITSSALHVGLPIRSGRVAAPTDPTETHYWAAPRHAVGERVAGKGRNGTLSKKQMRGTAPTVRTQPLNVLKPKSWMKQVQFVPAPRESGDPIEIGVAIYIGDENGTPSTMRPIKDVEAKMANPDQKARIGALAEAQARRNQGAEIQAAREIFPLVDEFRTNDIDVSTIASVLHDIGDHAKKTGEDNARVVAVAAGSTPAEIAAAVAAAVPTLVFATEPPAH